MNSFGMPMMEVFGHSNPTIIIESLVGEITRLRYENTGLRRRISEMGIFEKKCFRRFPTFVNEDMNGNHFVNLGNLGNSLQCYPRLKLGSTSKPGAIGELRRRFLRISKNLRDG